MNPKQQRRKATRRAHRHADSAWAAVERGELDLAIREMKRAVDERADNPRLWYDYGRVLQLAGRTKEAIRAFRNALLYVPNYAEVHAQLAELFARLGKTILAEKHARYAVECDPQRAAFRTRHAELLALVPEGWHPPSICTSDPDRGNESPDAPFGASPDAR